MSTRYRRSLPFLVMITLIIAILTLPLVGARPSTGQPTLNPDELEDLRFVADELGITDAEAVSRFGWNSEFSRAMGDISTEHSDDFTRAEITGDSTAWVAFAGETPAGAQRTIDSFRAAYPGVTVEIRTGTGFTASQISSAVPAAHYAVFGSSDVSDASTSFDFDSKRIIIRAKLYEGAPVGETLTRLQSSAEQAVTDALGLDFLQWVNIAVETKQDTGILDSDDYQHYGGESLAHCTSGFGVVDSSGVTGIATAGHCQDQLYDDGEPLTWQDEHRGQYGDVQWLTGPQVENHEFYSGSRYQTEVYMRPVERIGIPAVGDWVCRNGRQSHKDCQRIYELDVCNGDDCKLVKLEGRMSAGADSGGPVYWGRAAYGFHQGAEGYPRRDVFSRADYIDEALGVSIIID